MLKQILRAGGKTGLALAAATSAAILLAGQWENKAPWSAVNAIAHIVDGDEKTQPATFSPRESGLGLLVNATAMLAWGMLYEGALRIGRTRSTPWTGAAAAFAAYVIDYKIVPPRLRPGIEKAVGPAAVFASYAVLALTLALSSRWNRYPER